MSESVPMGRGLDLLGTRVTSVRAGRHFANENPCFAFLLISQPSFTRSFINCLPLIAGRDSPITRLPLGTQAALHADRRDAYPVGCLLNCGDEALYGKT